MVVLSGSGSAGGLVADASCKEDSEGSAWGSGGVIIPEGVREGCGHGILGHGLVVMVVLG